jgi:hypothetical protein
MSLITTEEICPKHGSYLSYKMGTLKSGCPKCHEEEKQELWPSNTAGVPSSMLRSALFGIVEKGKRDYIKHKKIASLKNITIFYTGEQLDQSDLDVYDGILEIIRATGSTRAQFTTNHLLAMIGRSSGRAQYEWLRGSIRRLLGALVEITCSSQAYTGSLLDEWIRDEQTQQNVVTINKNIFSLYAGGSWTTLKREDRQALRGKQLALWLQAFYSTHREPYSMHISTLKELCGSRASRDRDFAAKMRAALKDLEAATGWQCAISEDGKVDVVREPQREVKKAIAGVLSSLAGHK